MTEPLDLDKIRAHAGPPDTAILCDELEACRTERADWEKMCDETATVRDAAVEALKVAATELDVERAKITTALALLEGSLTPTVRDEKLRRALEGKVRP